MLEMKALTHSYGENRILENFCLSLKPGQRIALMGPSGAGKTTVLRIVLGLLTPDQGTVENGFTKVAVVFQEPRLLPWRTAAENVNLVLGDGRGTMPKALRYLKLLGLEEAAGKYPHELSGGMQQRAALARAMALEGDLLILDEPFKGLDEALRFQVIRQVAQTDAAVLLVTHDEEEAVALGCEILQLPALH